MNKQILFWNNGAGKCFVINLQSSLQYYILVVTVFAPAVKLWMPVSQASVATIFKYSTTSSSHIQIMSYSKTASRIYLVLYILVGFKTLFKVFCLFFLFWNLI